MEKSKRVIVNLATDNYSNSRTRLKETLAQHWKGDVMLFHSEDEVGSPKHADCPYGFKVYTIKKAIEAGYEQILWIDSSVYPIRDIEPIFDEIDRDGFIFQDAGHPLGTWTNDRTLDYFGITREESMGIRMIGNAGFLGFDFTKDTPRDFFHRWEGAMLDGQFNESGQPTNEVFKAHRWDMSCSSAIVYKMGLTHLMKDGIRWLRYALPDVEFDETVFFKAPVTSNRSMRWVLPPR